MAAPTLSAATITQESGKFGWTDVNFDHGVTIKELAEAVDGSDCFFDTVAKKITMNGHTSGTFGAFYEIEITVPFHFSGLKGNIVVNKEASSGSGPDNYYYPTVLTTWNQSYHEIFVNGSSGGMITGSEHQIIANSAGFSSGTQLTGGGENKTTFTQTYTQTTGMKPTNIIRIRMYQDHARHWSIAASDFNIQALPDVSFPIVQMAFSAAIANNANVNADDFSLKIHGESTPIGKVLTDSGNVLLLPGVDKRSPLVTNSPILSSALAAGSGGTVSTLATGFNNPYGITVVGTTAYVCDFNTNRIKKITSDGTMTTFAGSGTHATTDGTGTAAAFKYPYGITNDGTNLYVVASGSHAIRKIVIATAVVTTFAGTAGTSGFTDATGTSAKFNTPRSIMCDNAGANLYVTDQNNYRIRKIVISTGAVTTLAGSGVNGDSDGTGTAAQFSTPRGIAIDSTDANLYVLADTKIRKIVIATGVVTTLATVTGAVRGITIDNSNEYLYFPKDGNQIIVRLKLSDNSVTTYAGAADSSGNTNGALGDARFNSPRDIFMGSNNTLYVTETGTDQLRKIVSNPDSIELTFNSNIKNVATYNAGDFVVTDSTTTVTIAPSVSSNKLVLSPSGHTFSNLTNVRIVYTRHATANRNLLYTDDTAIESFDLLLDNNLSAVNRTKAIEVTYTKHGTANRNIANASGAAVASFSNNNDNTAAPTLSSMTIGAEGSRMGGWRKLDYTGGVKITELGNYDGNSFCKFYDTTNTISMGGSTSGTFGAFYQIDITVPYKITGLRGQLSVQSDVSASLADDRYYPEDLTTWVQSYHEINRNVNEGSWVVGTDKQIIARVGGTDGSGVLSTPSKGDGKSDIPHKVPILLKYVQTTSMTSTNIVRIQVYQDHARHWTLKELQLEVLPDPSLKLIELNFSGTVYFGSNTKKDIFSVKRGNESVKVIDAKSVGSKILLLTGGEFTHVDQANVEYYNDKFSSIAANGNNLDITLSNNVLITDDIDNDITLKTTSGTQINVDADISSGKLSLTKKGNIDLTSEHSPLRNNFAYSHSTSTTITNDSYKIYRSFDVSYYTRGYFTGDAEYNASDGTYTGSTTTSGYSGQWFQIDVGVPTIVTKIEAYFNDENVRFFKDYRIFGSADNSTFTQILNVTNRPNEQNLYCYNISGASSARYYRIVVNKNHGINHIQHQGYFKFIGIPDSSVSFPDTNYTVEYNQSNIDKLVKTSDVNISIPSFKIVNGVDNTFQMRNISGNTIGSFTKDNGDSGTPSCTSVSIANESSNMGGWRKLDYTGGVKITELANVAANGTVCIFDDTTNTISMNGSASGTFGAFYQIDITVPYKITGLRGQLSVQSDVSASLADDRYYPEDLTTWVQTYLEINRNANEGSWVVGTDKQIIARVGGTNGSGVLSTPSIGDGKSDIPYKIPVLLKYVQTTSMTSTNVVRIQVYQDHARHWTLKELQLEVLPDTNLKIVELNFSSNVTINSSLKKDIISLKRGGEKINIVDIKESTSKALLLTDGVFEHANEIDVQYYQDKVSNVSVDSNNLQLTFTNNITSKESLDYRDFTVTNLDGIVVPIKPTISSGKLVISKSNLEISQYIDLTSPDSIFKNDFFHTASSYYNFNDVRYTADASFVLNNTSYHFGSEKDDYSGTDAAYAGTITTNGYGGQWLQIDIGRQVTVRLIKFKFGANGTHPKEVKVFGSNDDSSWTEIAQLDYQGLNHVLSREQLTLTAASYRYYRFVVGKIQTANADTHVWFAQEFQLLGLPESGTFTNTKYKIEYNKNGVNKDQNLIRNSDPTIVVPSFKIISGIDCTTTISNYKGTSISSFNQNSGDSAAPSFHSAAIVNENSKFGWQKVTMGVPTITIVEKTDNETMVWDNTAKTATMSGSTSSAFGSVIQLDFTAPCFFVGLRGQFKMESLTTNKADDYYYPETLSTWDQAKTAISPNNNYGANLLGSDKQIIARVGGTNGSKVLNNPSQGDGIADTPQSIPIFLKYVQTTSMTETNIIRIKIYQDSRNHYKLSGFQLEVLPATTYKIVELTFTENMINKDFDCTDLDIKGIGEVGTISNALTNSGKVYLLPSVRVPVLNSLNLRYKANTFSSIAAVAGNLDITFSNDVAVSGSLNSDNFVVKDPNGYTIPVTPTISSNKVRLTKVGNIKFSHDKSFNQRYSASDILAVSAEHYYVGLAFNGSTSGSYWWATKNGMYSSGTYVGENSTSGYNGDWIQVDVGTTVVLNNLKIFPGHNTTHIPKTMRLFYSSNGASWTQGVDWTNLTAADDWQPSGSWSHVAKTGLAISGRYFRLAINETLGGTYAMISEIELYGYVGSTSFTSTDGTVIYTKSHKASENIVNASDSSQAIGSFTLFNGSEDLTGHLTDVAGNTQPAFNVLSSDTTAPTISSSSLSGANLTLVFSEDIYEKDTYNTADFDVQLSGDSMTVNSLSISSGDIVLALASTPSSANALRVVYTKHATSNRNIVDSAGNAVANFTHIPSNDSTPPTFSGITIGGVHTGTGLIESVITKSESDYAPNYSSIALASGNIEVTFTSNVANTGDISNYTIKQGGTAKNSFFSISGGKLVIEPGYTLDVSAYDIASSASSLSGQSYSASSSYPSNIDQYIADKAFDNNNTGSHWISDFSSPYDYDGTGIYQASVSTEGYKGEWVQVDIGQTVLLTSFEIHPRTAQGTYNAKNMRLFSSTNGTNWTQVQDWTGLTIDDDWKQSGSWTHISGTVHVIGRYFRLVVNELNDGYYAQIGQLKLLGVRHTSETTAITFSTLGNIEVDYTKGTGTDNLRDSNGFDVPSFEITNNVNTTGVVPEYSSIGVSSNSIEVTFNQTLVDPGSLNKDDFHVTYNGSVASASPSISGGKLVLTGIIGLNTTSYDLSSTSSSLSGQAYTSHSARSGNVASRAFDDDTGTYAQTGNGSVTSGTTTIDGSSVTGAWVQVDVGQSVLLEYFTIYYHNTSESIKSAKIAASTDGSTWTEIHAITDRAHNTGVTETYNISSSNYQHARYYRIVATAVQGSTRLDLREWTLFGVTQAQTTAAVNFTSTSNLIVDYMKHHSTTARRLQNSDGDEVASFEITNGVLSNDQEKPTFSNVTVASGKLELTFSENIAAAGTLNKADFTVTDSGTNRPIKTPTISSGKLLLERDEYVVGSETPIDVSSSSSSLSGSRTYTASSIHGGSYVASKAFDDNTTGTSWICQNNKYSSGTYSGSESTEGYSGEWVQVDVGINILLTSYQIYPRNGGDSSHVKNMRFFYSTDGTSWTQLRDWTGLTLADDWKVGGSYTSKGPYSTSTVGRYFRIVINEGVGGTYCQIGELKLLGIDLNDATALTFANTNVTIKYTKHDDASRHLIRVNDPSDTVDSFTITNGFDNTPAAVASKDGILIDLDENIASSSGYAAGNFAVTEGSTSKSVRAVKITPDNKVFLSMLANINKMSDTNITYTPSGTASENLETSGGVKTLAFTITNGSDATSRTNDRIVLNFSENIISKTTYSPGDFKILDSVTKTSTTTFASIAVASGKLELSFNNNVAVTGALNKSDFTLEDTSGNTVGFLTPTISGGKVVIENSAYDSSGTSIDISSSTSSLSGSRTYTSSTDHSSSYVSSKAFDNNNTGSTWISTDPKYVSGSYNASESTEGYNGEWVQVDVGTNVILTSYEIYPRGNSGADNYHAKNMRFFSSTNGSNWSQVHDWTGLTLSDWKPSGSYGSIGPYTTSSVYGRYFRLVINNLVGGGSYAQIGEIKLLGYAQASEPSRSVFSNTNYLITYTKHATASRNIVKASATTDAIDSFRIDSGSETGLLKKVAQVGIVSGDVQLKTPVKADNQTSIDISSSSSALTGTRTYSGSTQYNGSYPYSEAFDNIITGSGNGWVSGNNTYSSGDYPGSNSTDGYNGEYVQVDVGTTVVLTSYEIYPRQTTDTNHAEKMRFFSSTNGTDWTQVQDWTGLTLADDWKPSGSYGSIGPYSTGTYGRYFRLAVNKLLGNGKYAQIGDIKLLGYAATSDTLSSDAGLFEITYTHPGIQGRNLVDLAGNVVQTFTGRDRPAFGSATLTTTRIAQVTFSVNLKDMSPLKTDFNVKLNGTSTSIESVSISGGKLIINLVRTMTPHSDAFPAVLTLDYTKNSSSTYNLRDAGDSAVESFVNKSINNPTSDTEPPVFIGAEIFDDAPTKVVLNFDFAVTISSPNVSVFQVKVNGSAVTISSVAIVSGDIVLTLASAVSHNSVVTVSYTKDASDANKNIKDVSSNVLETPLKSEHGTIAVKVDSGKFTLEGESQKEIYLVKGFTYEFDTSDSTVASHAFKLSTTSNGSHNSGSEYTTGVTHAGTAGSSGAKLTFVVPNGAPATLYYYCSTNSGIGGKINISADAHTPVVNSVVATAVKSFKNDVQSGGIRDGVIAKRWSRFRTDKSKLTIAQRKYYGKDYFRSNPAVKIFKIIDEQNGQSIAFLRPATTGDPGAAQELNLDENEAEISFDNVTAEQSSLLSFTFDPQRNGSTTNTIQVKILFVKRITGDVAKFTYTLNGYTGNGIYSGKVVLVPAFTGGGTTGLITVTNMAVDTDQTINCDMTIEYTSSPGTTVDYTKSFTFFARNPAGGYSNDNTSTAGDPYIKTVNGQFYKLRDIPHKSVILYDNNNSERRIQLHAYLEPNVNYKKQINEYDDTLVSQMGERPINPAFFSKLWIRNREQEYFIDLETWIETKTGKNIIDLFNVDFAIETCRFHVYLSEKCVTVKLPVEDNFFIIIKRFINPEIRTGIELSIPTWMSSPLAYGALLYPGETNDLFIDKIDDKSLKRKARRLKNMSTVRENFSNPETGSVKVVDWKY